MRTPCEVCAGPKPRARGCDRAWSQGLCGHDGEERPEVLGSLNVLLRDEEAEERPCERGGTQPGDTGSLEEAGPCPPLTLGC